MNGEAEEEFDPTLPECAELLQGLDEWDFPIFDLADCAGDMVLSQVGVKNILPSSFISFHLVPHSISLLHHIFSPLPPPPGPLPHFPIF